MPPPELVPIGTFAKRCGITASALRFYADSGVLQPAEVDPATGYRLYAVDQLDRAILLRRLREIDLPLADVVSVLGSDADAAVRIIEAHAATVADGAAHVRSSAALLAEELADADAREVAAVSGTIFASAIEQVLTVTWNSPDFPVLNGIQLSCDGDEITMVATDRYRLTTRTLPATVRTTAVFVVDADDLRACLTDVRRLADVSIERAGQAVRIGGHRCRILDDEFPDYRAMLDALSEPVTCVATSRAAILAAVEAATDTRVTLAIGDAVAIGDATVAASVAGPPMIVHFEVATLYPALFTAIGDDLLLDFRAPDQPVTVRSADRGDLTTLAMPTLERP